MVQAEVNDYMIQPRWSVPAQFPHRCCFVLVLRGDLVLFSFFQVLWASFQAVRWVDKVRFGTWLRIGHLAVARGLSWAGRLGGALSGFSDQIHVFVGLCCCARAALHVVEGAVDFRRACIGGPAVCCSER